MTFRLSVLTVCEMRGSVECTTFVRACLCLHARAHVSPDLLDYLIDYPLSLDPHIWQSITLFRSYLSTLYHIHLVVRTVLVLQYSYLCIHLTLVTVSLSVGNVTGRHRAHHVSA